MVLPTFWVVLPISTNNQDNSPATPTRQPQPCPQDNRIAIPTSQSDQANFPLRLFSLAGAMAQGLRMCAVFTKDLNS